MNADQQEPWRAAVTELIDRARLVEPAHLMSAVNAAAARLDLTIVAYLVDHEQRRLWPVPERGRPVPEPLVVNTTLAGRAYMATAPTPAPGPGDGRRLWMPLLDGSERLGVLDIQAADAVVASAAFQSHCVIFAALVGHLVSSKIAYGDGLVRIRRTRRLSVPSELLWRMLPPLTFACDRFAISALLEPCYDVGGDGFDYAVDDGMAYLALLDTAGHGLQAGLGTAVALSASRAARRDGQGLSAIAGAVDAALGDQFTDARFTTAVLIELDLNTGALRYLNAGHPAPLVLRGAKVVHRLDGGRRMPLGVDDARVEVAEEALQPGDRLLCYTDGVVDATDATGAPFGEQRLVDLAERHAGAGLPAPETLRRLSHAVLEHLDGPPSDDATLMLVEWSHSAGQRIQP